MGADLINFQGMLHRGGWLSLVLAFVAALGSAAAAQDYYGNHVPDDLAERIRGFNELLNTGRYDDWPYAWIRQEMTRRGLPGAQVSWLFI